MSHTDITTFIGALTMAALPGLATPAALYRDGMSHPRLLWNGKAPPPRTPEDVGMPLSRQFPRRGIVDMRSGWQENGCLFSFTCGGNPTYGHGQYDSGHFALYAGASALAGDTGYGGGQSDDHNTVLFDGVGQKLKCPEGRLVGFEPSPEATYAAGRLGDLYANNALKSYIRHVCFVHDRARPYAVVYDEMETDGREHTYSWMLQGVNDHGFMMSGEGIDIDVAGDFPELTDTNTGWKLRVVMFAAAEPQFTTDVKEIAWNPTAKAVPHPRLRADIRTAGPPDILTVLLPHRGDDEPPSAKQIGPRSVRVAWSDRTESVEFPNRSSAEAGEAGLVFSRTP